MIRQTQRRMLQISAVAVAITLALSLWAWRQVPADATVPVHWNLWGEVDRYGGVFEGLFVMPLVLLGLSVLFYFLPKLDPRGDNILRSLTAYRALWLIMLLFFVAFHIVTVLSISGQPINMTRALLPLLALLMIGLGNYMGKIRRNYTMGIRTPWTLASDVVWDKTHRLGGRLFVAGGLVALITALIFNPVVALAIFGGLMLLTVLGTMVYSYWLWRNEAKSA